MSVADPLVYARAIHFAAALLAAGVVFFHVFIATPALRKGDNARVAAVLQPRLAAIAWVSLALTVISGAAWLLLTAQSMSEQPLAEVWSQGVLWTVLSRTEFGNDWLLRLAVAGLLAVTFVQVLRPHRNSSRTLEVAATVLAAALVGSLAWAGHAVGASGLEGMVHPAADALHLVAAAAWIGALPLLALLLAAAEHDDASVAMARTATLRFSTLGIVSVGTLVATGIVNTWYLVGSIPALTGTPYGQLLLVKLALFLGMVGIAAVNRFCFTPRLASNETATAALRQLRRNAVIESVGGAVIVCIVAMLGTMPPASHANHHAAYGAVPADAAFIHIHSGQGMADVTILPGRVGTARATIRLWNDNFYSLDVREMTLTLTPPAAANKPTARMAAQDSDGAWQVKGIELPQPGNWTVTVDAVLGSKSHLVLDAPIVIEPGQ
jgi:putative copper resistance protein D